MADESIQDVGSETGACPPEWTLSFYVDRELELDDRLRVDAHLVHCRACRERVLALEMEGDALRAVLSLEDRVETVVRRVAVGESLTFGAGTATAAGVTSLAVLAWLLALPVPPALEWLNPLDGRNIFALFFDVVAILRDQGPAFYQFGVASIALLSAAFLMTTSFTLVTRRFLTHPGTALLLGLLGLSALAPAPSSAIEFLFDVDKVELPAGEVVEETWVTTAESVLIEGTLRGDLVALGDRVVIAGVVDGNLISGARRVEITGRVSGSTVTFGDRVRIEGSVDQGAYSAAGQTTLAESGRVGRSLAAVGDGLLVSGVIDQDLHTYVEWFELRGQVGRDVVAYGEQVDVLAMARIGGDLDVVHLEASKSVVVDDSAAIAGEVTIAPEEEETTSALDRYASADFYIYFVLSLAAAFFAGLVLYRLAPWFFSTRFEAASDLVKPLGYGFVLVFAVPIGLVLLALTIVGIPIALAGLASLAACFYLAKIIVGGAIGLALLGAPEESAWREFALPLIAGLGILFVVTSLPFVGGVLGFLTLLVGSGAIALRIRERMAR